MTKDMKKRLFIIGAIVFVIILIVLVIRAGRRSQTAIPTPSLPPEKQLKDFQNIEGDNHDEPPDIRDAEMP